MPADELAGITCAHPLKGLGGGYDFAVPLLDGDHVTDDAGTGFVHTAPGHGREDFDVWMDACARPAKRAASTSTIPFTVDDAGFFTKDAPGFGPDREGGAGARHRRQRQEGRRQQGASSTALIEREHAVRARPAEAHLSAFLALEEAGHLPQHAAMVRLHGQGRSATARRCARRALTAIDDTRFVPAAGQNRLRAMIEERPDWVLSRQRAWGVPICVFADADGNVLKDEAVNARILEAFEEEGADAWFAEGAAERFLGNRDANEPWTDGHRHSRRLVRFGLDPRLHAGGPRRT